MDNEGDLFAIGRNLRIFNSPQPVQVFNGKGAFLGDAWNGKAADKKTQCKSPHGVLLGFVDIILT
jgi:hypothetical protein